MKKSLYYKDARTAYIFITPMVIIIVILVAYPVIKAFSLSMLNYRIGSGSQGFIGLNNYIKLLSDIMFKRAFTNTLIWTFGSVIFKLILGIILALVLNQNFIGSQFARILVLVPWVIPTPISGLVWTWILNDMGGVLNYILQMVHLIKTPVAWLGISKLALLSVIGVNVWRGTPFFAINLLAGLKSIPKSHYEAAEVDGANRFQKFLYITLPGLKYVIIICILLESIWAMGDFSIVHIMTRGGPAGATHLISTYTYEIGFLSGDLGRAIAISLFPLPILAFLIIALTRLIDKENA